MNATEAKQIVENSRKRMGAAMTDDVLEAIQWANCATKNPETEKHVGALMGYYNTLGMIHTGVLYKLEDEAGIA